MLEKIKDNYLLILLCLYLLFCLITGVYTYKVNNDEWFKDDLETYEKCKTNNTDEVLCNRYIEPPKQRDTLSTLGYITITDSRISFLQTLAPLLIMITATYNFHKKLKKGYFKNSIIRIGYKSSFKKLYIDSLKYSLILPIFLFIIFLCSYFISGNFDYKYGSSFYMFDAYGVANCRNVIIFLILYLSNFILHSIFWINIAIYNCKHNKNFIVCIIFSYIEYLLLFVFTDMFFAGTLFANTELAGYFSFTNIWTFSELNIYGVFISSLVLAILSTIIICFEYKNKENVIEEIS